MLMSCVRAVYERNENQFCVFKNAISLTFNWCIFYINEVGDIIYGTILYG